MDLDELRMRVAMLRDIANQNPHNVEAQGAAGVAIAILHDVGKEGSITEKHTPSGP